MIALASVSVFEVEEETEKATEVMCEEAGGYRERVSFPQYHH